MPPYTRSEKARALAQIATLLGQLEMIVGQLRNETYIRRLWPTEAQLLQQAVEINAKVAAELASLQIQ